MKRFSIILVLLSSLLISACDEDGNIVLPTDSLTNSEVIAGLREALRVGTDSSVSRLSATNGYFADAAVKILLPTEVQNQINAIESVAGSNALVATAYNATVQPLVSDMILALNKSAEDAATKATPIFVDAITGITIEDGFDILNGTDTAATSYLKGRTYTNLFDAFQPDIDQSLSKDLVSGLSANDLFSDYVSAYNTAAAIPFSGLNSISDVSLSEHVTTKGLDGLFLKVAEEEKNIRTDPISRVTDILERVFGN